MKSKYYCEIYSLLERVSEIASNGDDVVYEKQYGNGLVICIRSEARDRFDLAFHNLCECNSGLGKRYSQQKLKEMIVDFVVKIYICGKEVVEKDVKEFEKSILSAHSLCDSVAVPVRGLSISGDIDIKFGPFTLISYPKSKEITEVNERGAKFFRSGLYLMIHGIDACDGEKIYEDTLEKANDFRYILQFMVGERRSDMLVAFDVVNADNNQGYFEFYGVNEVCLIKGRCVVGYSLKSIFAHKFLLNEELLVDESNGNRRIWDFYSQLHNRVKLYNIAERIIRSVLSLGKSMTSLNAQEAWIHLATGYEILLANSTGEAYGCSIRKNISHAAAIIVGNSVEERLKIEKDIKDFYDDRSSIVHNSKQIGFNYRYFASCDILVKCIRNLLNDPRFLKMKTIQDLNSYLKNFTYSG